MKRLLAALCLSTALPAAAQEPPRDTEEDRLAFDSVTEDFQRRWKKAEEEKDWAELLKLYEGAVDRTPNRLARPDPGVPRWLRLSSVLGDRLGTILPEAARESREILAQQLLDSFQDREHRLRVIQKYGYTRAGRRALERAANEDFDEGRLRDAVRRWSRAMELRLTPELVARLAHAHAAAGDPAALAGLRAQVERQGCAGPVTVGGRTLDLKDYLASVEIGAGHQSQHLPPPLPLLEVRPPSGPSTEISLGSYDWKGDGGPFGRGAGSMVSALGTVEGRELAVVSNGLRILAIDPAAAEGGSLENAVEWRWPKQDESRIRYSMPSHYGGPSPSPQVGVTLSGRRAFATMFSNHSRQTQMGRRRDPYDGPAAIRAFDLATGELLWETDAVPTEAGSESKMIEQTPFGRLNFCFAGPPVVRGDRLYAAAMTALPDRQCYMVSFDAATGSLLWCTWVGTAPAMRDRCSVPTFTEEDGTIVVATNFGLIAALDSETGAVDWLVKYTGQGNRILANPPVFRRSLVYVLAADRDEPLAYDRWTGREVPMPLTKDQVQWPQVSRFLGAAGDWLVFSGYKKWIAPDEAVKGPTNVAVHLATGQVTALAEPESLRPPQGTIADGLLYLPTGTLLHVYDVGTWRRRDSFPWQGGEDMGRVVIAGALLAFQGDRFELFTGPAALKDRFAPRVDGSPPRAEPCRQLARILECSGRAKESVAYYRRALSLWEKDPAWTERTAEMRKKLDDLAEKLGDEFPKE